MNLPNGSLKVILKPAGWLLAASTIIVIANWPEINYWFEDLDRHKGEGEVEYAYRLMCQRAQRLCVEENGMTAKAYHDCMENSNPAKGPTWLTYIDKVNLFLRPDGKTVALAPGDPGFDKYCFVSGPDRCPDDRAKMAEEKRLDICGASTETQCEEILKVFRSRGAQAAEQLRVKYWEEYRASNPPPADDTPIPQVQPEPSEDDLMFQAAKQCQSEEDLKKPDCVTALNAYRMKAAQRILAEREANGPAPVPTRSGSSSYYPPPQPPPRDQIYYLHDGTRVQESPGGMRQITPPNQSALPTRK